jgi:hypothetical protein
MRLVHFLSASTIVIAALAADAAVIANNVPGVWAIAEMPGGGDKDILAQVSVASSAKGGVSMTVNINGGPLLPGGPFSKFLDRLRNFSTLIPLVYHIHEAAVPSNGNCTATGAHLDPQGRGETPACNARSPASCQVGDLSGKHGNCSSIPGCSKKYVCS